MGTIPPEFEAILNASREIEQDYLREKSAHQAEKKRTEALSEENNRLHQEYDRLYKRYIRENQRVQDLELLLEENRHVKKAQIELENSKRYFTETLLQLRKQVETLRTLHPLNDLLRAKEAEVERVKKAMVALPPRHPERGQVEALVRAHIAERDEVKRVFEQAQARFNEQLAGIESALQAGQTQLSE